MHFILLPALSSTHTLCARPTTCTQRVLSFRAGRRLQLRGDCTAACERLHAAGIDLQVVSVSWSGAMLRGALDAHLALDRRYSPCLVVLHPFYSSRFQVGL